jgi:hypothetical protein
MDVRARRPILVVAAVLAAGTAFLAGRGTAPQQVSSRVSGAGGAYASGVAAGEALGVQEGRALQEGAQLPADAQRPVKDAFDAGYVAGVNDVFSGYDGGWLTGVPYDHADARARCSSPTASHCVTRGPGRRPPRALPGSHAVCEQDS